MRVLIAGGGTGGHVMPGLAIARELRDKYGAEVRFVGTARGIETRLVPEAGFALELIRVGQLKNVSLLTRLRTFADLPLGILRCIRLLRSFKPQVVVGVGGYASGPSMMAAIMLRIPTLAYEPNAVPGLANRLVGKYVDAAAVSFEQTTSYFRNATVTGVPVRQAIFDVPERSIAAPPRLLVTAGSQGAKIFNDMLPGVVAQVMRVVPGLTVLHQAGARSVDAVQAAYEATKADSSRWEVRAFIDDMPDQYAACKLVLARAGSTVAEIAAAGRPSVLVPLPTAADDHQRKNAEVFAKAGAAVMMLQADVTPEKLEAELIRLLNDDERMLEMGRKARTLAHPGAVERIGGMVAGLVR
jgi:UDP-N-acetylglucosamine--N-acetylmuramyl-(pentapeptide) pyrophosphoryl-undecaprenol N-acetylglucosamine transferase